jgi:hypothetical protein
MIELIAVWCGVMEFSQISFSILSSSMKVSENDSQQISEKLSSGV